MGMDIYGLQPSGSAGEYFRRNMFDWSPLWSYVIHVGDEELFREHAVNWSGEEPNADFDPRDPSYGFGNEGYGLDAEGSQKLSSALLDSVVNGDAVLYIEALNAHIASIEMVNCHPCAGTGVRTDQVGIDMGMPDAELEQTIAVVVGRQFGTCNICKGYGKTRPFGVDTSFKIRDVEEFARFLRLSGGFNIY